MPRIKSNKRRNAIIVIAVIISAVLYIAGVLSGIFANKIVKEETRQDISTLKKETRQDLASLQSYVDFLDTNLKNMQLEQTFTETLNHDDMCKFSSISMNELVNQLGFYWSRLPFRLEEYENYNKVTYDYLLLKEQYAHLSIRTWMLAKSQYEKCNTTLVHGLFFYSANCSACVEQGRQIDLLSKKISNIGSNLIMFPIDFNSRQTIVRSLKGYYNITSAPAIIINDKVFQGRLFKAEELMKYPRKIKNEQEKH